MVLQESGQKFGNGVLAVSRGQTVQHFLNLVKETGVLVEAVREASGQISEKIGLALDLFAGRDDQGGLLYLFVDDRHLELRLPPPHTGGLQTEGGRGGGGDRGVEVGGDIERAVLGEEGQEVLQRQGRPSHRALDHQAGAAVAAVSLDWAGELHTAGLATDLDSLLEDLQSAEHFVKTFGEKIDLSLHTVSGLVQSAERVPPHHAEVHLVPHQVPDVVEAVLDHGGSLQAEAPGDHVHVLREPHGQQHLGSEDPAVADLDPLGQPLVVAEYLHAGLSVRVVGRLEPQLLYPELGEELVEDTDQVSQGQSSVSDDALDLMELSQVSGVQGLVPEDFVYAEIFLRLEAALLVGQSVQHPGRHCRGVSPQQVLSGLLHLPVVAVPSGAVAALAVDRLDSLQVVGGEMFAGARLTDEESVVSISGRMLLRLKIIFCRGHFVFPKYLFTWNRASKFQKLLST